MYILMNKNKSLFVITIKWLANLMASRKWYLIEGLEKEFYIPARNTFFPLPNTAMMLMRQKQHEFYEREKFHHLMHTEPHRCKVGCCGSQHLRCQGGGRCQISLLTVMKFGGRYTCWATGILTTSWALWLSIDLLWMSTSKSSDL